MRILKMLGISIGALLVLLIVSVSLTVGCAPQFGKSYSKKQKKEFQQLANYQEDHFVNQSETSMDIKYWDALKKQFQNDSSRTPGKNIPPRKLDSLEIVRRAGKGTYVSWLGHSAFLLEMDGKKILMDPMLGESPSPFSFMGPSRYSKELSIEIEKLPSIDLVIISHDHYDHLDHSSILKLKNKVKKFIVPLGVGAHLKHWDVPSENIHELNWWETIQIDGIDLVFTPSRHFSGRGLLDRSKTLWGSWVIKGADYNLYFSGDGGYDTHFKEIGNRFGPFDLALLECGQYNEQWKAIHMMPEETVQAAIDVQANIFMPIHWGAFTLAFHSWTDPVERAAKRAKELGVPMTTPFIGESIQLELSEYPDSKWWIDYINP